MGGRGTREGGGARVKVWIVTEGNYSDYHIVRVFSSKEKAEEFLPALRPHHSPYCEDAWTLEEFEIDAPVKTFVQFVYRRILDLKSGNSPDGLGANGAYNEKPRDWSSGQWYRGWMDVKGYSVVSQEHADKVAAETRQAALRGIETPLREDLDND